LVRVALSATFAHHPGALQYGHFLVDFYVLHPSDVTYNDVNQRYWLEYHPLSELQHPNHQTSCHLIRPTLTSEEYARASGLTPFRQWLIIHHEDTFIHGPFEFATINGRKTRDRISAEDWSWLRKASHLFSNQTPPTSLPAFCVHLNHHHSVHHLPHATARVLAYAAMSIDS